jgi:hypothetical protein
MQGFLGTETMNESTSVHIYPNPSEGILTIEVASVIVNQSQLVLTDTYGKVVTTHSINQHQTIIDCTQLRSGVYFYTVILGEETETGKFIIR